MLRSYTKEEIIVGAILIISIIFLFTDNTSRFFSGVWFFTGLYYIIKEKKYISKGLEKYFLIYLLSQAVSIVWAKEVKVSWHEFYRHIFGILPLFTLSQIKFLDKIKYKVLDIAIGFTTVYYYIYINLQFFKIVPSLSGNHVRYIGFGDGVVVKYAFIIGIQCIYMYFKILKSSKDRWAYILGLIMNLHLIALSGARGAWLGVLAAMTLMSVVYFKSLKKILLGTVFSGVILTIIYLFRENIKYLNYLVKRFTSITNTKSDYSNLSRIKMWEISIEKFKETNFLGLGYKNNLKYITMGNNFDHPHSDYFYILSSSGIIGILAYIYFLIGVFLVSLKNIEKDIWLFVFGIAIFLGVYGVVEVLIQTYLTLTVTLVMLSFANIGAENE